MARYDFHKKGLVPLMRSRYHQFAAKQAAGWRKNWYFAPSVFALLCLFLTGTDPRALGLQLLYSFLAALAAVSMAGALPEGIIELLKKARWRDRLLPALSGLGICHAAYVIFFTQYISSGLLAAVAGRLSQTPESLLRTAGVLGVVCGFPALFAALSFLYAYLFHILRENALLDGLGPWERRLYFALLLAFFVLAAFTFTRSDCFYSGGADKHMYNKIYSLDCGIIAERRESAYLNLRNSANRQIPHMLFAPFAAPFTAVPYLFALPFPQLPFLRPLLTQYAQLFLLLLSYLMLARMLKLAPAERMWFLLLVCAAYPTLLFSVAMEKFIIALFWSVLFLYTCEEGTAPRQLPLTGAGGCVASGVLLLPLTTLPLLRREPRRWLAEMVRRGALFLLSTVAFGRLDALLDRTSVSSSFFQYFSVDSPLLYRFQQYTAFIQSCFLAPTAGPLKKPERWDSWWMLPVTSVSLVGLVILLLCGIGFYLHRRLFIARAAAGWAAVSCVVLFLLGWDIQENSSVLFSLYFGWAFWVPLFLFLKTLWRKRPVLLPAVCGAAACLLLAWNVPRMAALFRFAAGTYPPAG